LAPLSLLSVVSTALVAATLSVRAMMNISSMRRAVKALVPALPASGVSTPVSILALSAPATVKSYSNTDAPSPPLPDVPGVTSAI
jgi:hypothetical protein